ncbi:hypothetical protein KP509_02G022300 [Ceratopteris richardii]|uniref:Uncharacterized protein n=1 Tax=Ceratopteris richardii TaxID=49495 RepID=A0A8T2VF97_CERRI|nr:hypothetical protein KP509_02G022300 [Ceratopteris richardii]
MELTSAERKFASALESPAQQLHSSAADSVSVFGELSNIVIPPIPCSFPWRNHPDYKALTEMSGAWVLAHYTNMVGVDGRRSSFAADHLIKSAFHMQATLPYADGMTDHTLPYADGMTEHMPRIIKMMDWYFMIDNVFDDPCLMGTDPERNDKVVEALWTVFLDTYVHPCPSPNPVIRVLIDTAAEWLAEMWHDMPSKQKASRKQIHNRDCHQRPDMETYLQIRDDFIGWWPCAVLI